MTAAGRVALRRRSLRRGRCGHTAYLADERVGLDGFLSPGATRRACLAAASWSFDVASDRLDEFAGVRIDDETIRRHCHRAAAAAAAAGEVEVLTDGVTAPGRDGRREPRMGLSQVRPRGEPAGPGEWADRELPPPTASAAEAPAADRDAPAATWRARAEAPGIAPDGPPTALADDARGSGGRRAGGPARRPRGRISSTPRSTRPPRRMPRTARGRPGRPGGWGGAGPGGWPTAGRGGRTTSGRRPPAG